MGAQNCLPDALPKVDGGVNAGQAVAIRNRSRAGGVMGKTALWINDIQQCVRSSPWIAQEEDMVGSAAGFVRTRAATRIRSSTRCKTLQLCHRCLLLRNPATVETAQTGPSKLGQGS